MPTTYHRRPTPCTNCGDVVLVAESRLGGLFGLKLRWGARTWLEHADVGPDGEAFDAVDEGCRRPRVAG